MNIYFRLLVISAAVLAVCAVCLYRTPWQNKTDMSAENGKSSSLPSASILSPGLHDSSNMIQARTQGSEFQQKGDLVVKPQTNSVGSIPHQSIVTPTPTTAHYEVEGQTYDLEPNQLGVYPRVYVKAGQLIPIELKYDRAAVTEPVGIQVEDGGALANKKAGQVVKVDASGLIHFDFTAGVQDGIYRVTLVKGDDRRTLDFWVGPELPVRDLTQNASTH